MVQAILRKCTCRSFLLLHGTDSKRFATGNSYKFGRIDECFKLSLEILLKPRGIVKIHNCTSYMSYYKIRTIMRK